MFIGVSMSEVVLPTYKAYFPGNHIMRIFPTRTATIGGKSIKVPPDWTDSRLTYCRDTHVGPYSHVIPFVSSKGDGTDAFVAWIRDYFINMPSWIKQIYYCDWHEPEVDFGAGSAAGIAKYKGQQQKLWAMFEALAVSHPTLRAKIKFGPVLTKQWTEDTGKGNFHYNLYDPGPGVGDFFGIDSYVLTNTGGDVVNPTTMPTAAAFLTTIKGYKYDSTDNRPRIFPELGLIGMPADTDGTDRAGWIQDVHDELLTWQVGHVGWTQPWSFDGWIWWGTSGKGTGEVPQVGQARDFPLHLRSVPEPSKTYTDAAGKTHWISHPETIPGSPPPPVATFNAIWTAVDTGAIPDPDPDPGPDPAPDPTPLPDAPAMLVGATMKKEDLLAWEGRLARNLLMRIFPNSDGLPPSWTDPRFLYCQRNGTKPFVSSNIDGNSAKFAAMLQWIINMPAWLRDRDGVVLLLTDRHEPENGNNLSPAAYQANYKAWWTNVILQLPAVLRAKVQAGPILTRQWTENTAGRVYSSYDPGPAFSDLFGVDMYANSWGSPSTAAATSYPNATTFLSHVKAYRYDAGGADPDLDTRDRYFPELGAIGLPVDTDGSMRADWIRALFAQLDTWTVGAQGWAFKGVAWWNNNGTPGATSLTGIGKKRVFYLDTRQNGIDSTVLLPGDPPAPLYAYNQVAIAHLPDIDPDPDPDPGTDPDDPNPTPDPDPPPDPPVVVPPVTDFPVDSPAELSLLAADYTVLVTDANLVVQGDPIYEWSSLQASIRWKEPGSGLVEVPAHSYIRDQLTPGCRIVILRRLLGTQHVLMAGPLEKRIRERADDGEKGGVGTMSLSFVDDSAWLGARLAYPNPALAIEDQTTDYWVFSGDPESAMLELVSKQAGAEALLARRVPKLRVAGYSGVAGTGTVVLGDTSDVDPRERLEKLTDVLRKICTLGANPAGSTPYHPDSLGFRVRQTRIGGVDVLLFEPLRSRDLAGEVHFSFARGNLKYYSYEETAPNMTHALVGGSGEGADRDLRQIITADTGSLAWGSFEGYVSEAGTDTLDQMTAAAKEAFADKGQSARLSSNAADTVDCRYGVHYDIGDLVSVELDVGEFEIAPVQTVNVQAWPTAGEVVGTTIGDQSARFDNDWIRKQREWDRRLGRLERR